MKLHAKTFIHVIPDPYSGYVIAVMPNQLSLITALFVTYTRTYFHGHCLTTPHLCWEPFLLHTSVLEVPNCYCFDITVSVLERRNKIFMFEEDAFEKNSQVYYVFLIEGCHLSWIGTLSNFIAFQYENKNITC